MRSNRVKFDLAAGKHVFGTMVFEFFSPGMPQIAKTAGAEFVLFDMEHSGVTIETLKGQFAACRGIGITPMVRVPALQYHFIARCLDMGAGQVDAANDVPAAGCSEASGCMQPGSSPTTDAVASVTSSAPAGNLAALAADIAVGGAGWWLLRRVSRR